MHARNDLADAGLYAGLLSKIGDILASLTDDNTRILSAYERPKCQGVVSLWRR